MWQADPYLCWDVESPFSRRNKLASDEALILWCALLIYAVDLAGLGVAGETGMHAVGNAHVNCAALIHLMSSILCCCNFCTNVVFFRGLSNPAETFLKRPVDIDRHGVHAMYRGIESVVQ